MVGARPYRTAVGTFGWVAGLDAGLDGEGSGAVLTGAGFGGHGLIGGRCAALDFVNIEKVLFAQESEFNAITANATTPMVYALEFLNVARPWIEFHTINDSTKTKIHLTR